ncbi:hypothetical protein [Sinomonas soli]
MDSLLTAGIGATFGLLGSLLLKYFEHRQTLARTREERRFSDWRRLEELRDPLYQAAYALHERIDNFRNRDFFVYLDDPNPERSRLALLGTMYRFGVYWSVAEELMDSSKLGGAGPMARGSGDAGLLNEISRTMASDRDGTKFMVWREEQRAIAELIRDTRTQGAAPAIGFASFAENYEKKFQFWFSNLERDLNDEVVANNDRLARLQDLLSQLIDELMTYRLEAPASR